MLDYWSRDMLNLDFLEKSLGMVSPPHFVYDFSLKNLLFYSNCLIAFISYNIGQYVYWNCLLITLWRHKIWN